MTSVDEGVGKVEYIFIVGGSVYWIVIVEISMEVLYKLNSEDMTLGGWYIGIIWGRVGG